MGLFLMRVFVWVVVPLLLIAGAVGPARSWRLLRKTWGWFEDRRPEPTEVLDHVVREHEKNLRALREVLQQPEAAQAEIAHNTRRSGTRE